MENTWNQTSIQFLDYLTSGKYMHAGPEIIAIVAIIAGALELGEIVKLIMPKLFIVQKKKKYIFAKYMKRKAQAMQ